jgi:hypothetical protein
MSNNDDSSGCTIWLIIFIPVAIIMGLTKGCTNLLFDKNFGDGQSSSFGLAIILLIVVVVLLIIKKVK